MNKQPKALKVLFFTEMWERYGFYTIQSILVFYMIKKFSLSDTESYAILGQFVALGFITPAIGGWVADRFLGSRIAILLGCLNLCLGYALLAFDHMLYIGLSFIIMGNGLLKSNISTFLGRFYRYNDQRREAGYTLYYLGINLGVLLATSSVGYIQKWLGWNACFVGASIAIVLGTTYFRWGYRYFEDKGLPPTIKAHTVWIVLKQKPLLMVGFFAVLMAIYYAMTLESLGSGALYVFGVLFCLYVAKISWNLESQARRRMLAVMLLFIMVIIFFALYLQLFFVVNVFVDRLVDRTIGGYEVPTAVFIGLESAYMLILCPFFARLWQSGKAPLSISAKFIWGLVSVSFAMQLLSWLTMDSARILPVIWIFIFYFLYTIGDLLVIPMGLSMVAEYVPQKYSGVMMGGFFMALGFGGKLAGILAGLSDVPKGVTDLHMLNSIYQQAFQRFAWLGLAMLLIFFIMKPVIQKLLKI